MAALSAQAAVERERRSTASLLDRPHQRSLRLRPRRRPEADRYGYPVRDRCSDTVLNAVDDPAPTSIAWSRVDQGDFSFEVPDDMKKENVQGIDSQVGRYRSNDATVTYDYGLYSGDCANEDAPEYRDTWTRIGGRFAHESYWRREPGERQEDKPATFYEYQGCVYFPNVEDPDAAATPSQPAVPLRSRSSPCWSTSENTWEDGSRTIGSIEFED